MGCDPAQACSLASGLHRLGNVECKPLEAGYVFKYKKYKKAHKCITFFGETLRGNLDLKSSNIDVRYTPRWG